MLLMHWAGNAHIMLMLPKLESGLDRKFGHGTTDIVNALGNIKSWLKITIYNFNRRSTL